MSVKKNETTKKKILNNHKIRECVSNYVTKFKKLVQTIAELGFQIKFVSKSVNYSQISSLYSIL